MHYDSDHKIFLKFIALVFQETTGISSFPKLMVKFKIVNYFCHFPTFNILNFYL